MTSEQTPPATRAKIYLDNDTVEVGMDDQIVVDPHGAVVTRRSGAVIVYPMHRIQRIRFEPNQMTLVETGMESR